MKTYEAKKAISKQGVSKADYEEEKKQLGDRVVVYVDGSCLKNGKKDATAGCGVFFGDNDPKNISERLPATYKQTNQEAELYAMFRLFQTIKDTEKVLIKYDSQYAYMVITEYLSNWKRNSWKKKDGSEPVNLKISKQIDELWTPARQRNTDFMWVARKLRYYGNAQADTLAKAGALLNHT